MGERAEARPRIVLTGATGFIGRHLQRELIAAGCDLAVVVRPRSAHRAAVHPAARVHDLELDDHAGLCAALREADFAIYGAGAVRGRDATDFALANVTGVRCFAQAAVAAMAHPRVLLLSSLAASRPQLSNYAASKRAGEAALAAQDGLAWTIVRPPAVYGPGDREMLPLFTAMRRGFAPRLGPPDQRLSLLHVTDLARAVRAMIECFAACRAQIFDLDDGRPGGYGWDDLRALARRGRPALVLPVPRALLGALAWTNLVLARLFGYRPMLSPGKVNELCEPRWLCNNQPLAAATGWRPQVALREGVDSLFTPAGQKRSENP
ncbi:MAG: NAD-dependent epimerase/dehydratase family protein [Gammaproteobacteria bacterium]|nr:NAD-dependent epimerase/dehydratase family protein [Gammaproteobacteria bacterium]MCP5201222.1 NAD-dependent epimerase/dehydratase family protein [Gammaproteobacteria bacterium]